MNKQEGIDSNYIHFNDPNFKNVDMNKLMRGSISSIEKCKYKLPCGYCDLKKEQCNRVGML